MKHHKILVFSLVAAVVPFLSPAATDAERNQSGMMNARKVLADEGSSGGVKVLFLGNSITLHGSLPKIGWTNVWGMAASERDKDYVHLVTRAIEAKTGRAAEVKVRNLAAFERNYRTWDVAKEMPDLKAFAPDYLIVALGENVPNLATLDDARDYQSAFARLIGRFMNVPKRPRAVIRGVFWRNPVKDEQMRRAAQEVDVPFVRTDFADEPGMKATGLFEHPGVQNHPSDKGMAETAARIVAAFFPAGNR